MVPSATTRAGSLTISRLAKRRPTAFATRSRTATAEARKQTRRSPSSARNDPPIAVPDTATVAEDGREDKNPYNIDVLSNDDDVDSDDDHASLRVVAAQSAAGAEVRFSGLAGAEISYAPAGRFEYLAVGETAIDTITYTVEDRHGARAASTVEVTVRGANDAPTANDDNASIDEDSTSGAAAARQRHRSGSIRPAAGDEPSTASRLSRAGASRLPRARA